MDCRTFSPKILASEEKATTQKQSLHSFADAYGFRSLAEAHYRCETLRELKMRVEFIWRG